MKPHVKTETRICNRCDIGEVVKIKTSYHSECHIKVFDCKCCGKAYSIPEFNKMK